MLEFKASKEFNIDAQIFTFVYGSKEDIILFDGSLYTKSLLKTRNV